MAFDTEEGWAPFWEKEDDDDEAVWDWRRGAVVEVAEGAEGEEEAEEKPSAEALVEEFASWMTELKDEEEDDGVDPVLRFGLATAEFEPGANQLKHATVDTGRSDGTRRLVRKVRAFARERGIRDAEVIEAMEALASASGNPDATLRAVGEVVLAWDANADELEIVAAMRETVQEAEAGVFKNQSLSWNDAMALLRALPVSGPDEARDWVLDLLRRWRRASNTIPSRWRHGRLDWDRFADQPLSFARFALEWVETTHERVHPHEWLHGSVELEELRDEDGRDDDDGPSAEALRRAKREWGL